MSVFMLVFVHTSIFFHSAMVPDACTEFRVLFQILSAALFVELLEPVCRFKDGDLDKLDVDPLEQSFARLVDENQEYLDLQKAPSHCCTLKQSSCPQKHRLSFGSVWIGSMHSLHSLPSQTGRLEMPCKALASMV